jgi:diguanylate cyclase
LGLGTALLQGIAKAGERRAKAGPKPADQHHRTTGIADSAIALIKALKLPATPRVYELCYAYASGEYPTVNIAIDDLRNRRVAVADTAVEQIAAKYVSPASVQDELHAVGLRVAHEVERLLGSLDTMTTTIGACSNDCADVGQAHAAAERRDALLAGVRKLLQSSGKIDDEKQRLEAALNASNAEIMNLRDQLQKIRTAAGSDPLTGLPNRGEFKPLLQQAIGETAGRGASLCVAAGDIDDFAAFNETWGYDRGDQVLRLVAMEMKQKVAQGTVVRSGGAQFAVILPGTSVDEAGAIAEDIRRSVMLREVTIRSTGQKLGRVGMSFGIASARADDTGETLAARTQACLRSAKTLGRNRVICETDPALAALQGQAAVA